MGERLSGITLGGAKGEAVSEVRCVKIKLKPGSQERVREWATEINRRKTEALATLSDEGVSIESAFLDVTPDGDFLIYYMRVENSERAQQIVRQSAHAIDTYHKQFQLETWEEGKRLELLIDLMLPVINPKD